MLLLLFGYALFQGVSRGCAWLNVIGRRPIVRVLLRCPPKEIVVLFMLMLGNMLRQGNWAISFQDSSAALFSIRFELCRARPARWKRLSGCSPRPRRWRNGCATSSD